jgi:hypothetical protein
MEAKDKGSGRGGYKIKTASVVWWSEFLATDPDNFIQDFSFYSVHILLFMKCSRAFPGYTTIFDIVW